MAHAFFVQRAFNKTGVANPVQVVRDGQEAIKYLQGVGKFAQRDNFPLPGIILLDLKLPFVMGLDVLKWIRQQSDLTPIVVILTSSAEEKDIATAYRLGANAYLVKPTDFGQQIRIDLFRSVPLRFPDIRRSRARSAGIATG